MDTRDRLRCNGTTSFVARQDHMGVLTDQDDSRSPRSSADPESLPCLSEREMERSCEMGKRTITDPPVDPRASVRETEWHARHASMFRYYYGCAHELPSRRSRPYVRPYLRSGRDRPVDVPDRSGDGVEGLQSAGGSGLATRVAGVYSNWAGVEITEAGREYLSAKGRLFQLRSWRWTRDRHGLNEAPFLTRPR